MAQVLDASTYLSLPALFRGKRDRFLAGLRGSRFESVPTSGGYFQLLDYSAISAVPDTQFADLLISEHGVAGLPVSGFGAQYANSHLLRFCFAKSDETIDKATNLLRAL
jgi:methionine aminotransferase